MFLDHWMSVDYEIKRFKSILRKYKYIDSWFWCRYSINSYNGCEHACIYCDARSQRYHLHDDFDSTVFVKANASEILDHRIARARTLLPDVVSMSGTSDPYQPAERDFEVTRGCLEILEKHEYPVAICTKSDLVLRDVDLLQRIGERTMATVTISISTMDDEKAAFLEPNAPSPEKRMTILEAIKETGGIRAGINLMPIVPVLADDPQMLEDVVQRASEAGADHLIFSTGATLRDTQGTHFIRKVRERYPGLVTDLLATYGARMTPDDFYEGRYNPLLDYARAINAVVFELCERYRINFRMKRWIPDDHRRENYMIAEKLLNDAYVEQMHGRPWKKRFWAGMRINNLRERISDVSARGALLEIWVRPDDEGNVEIAESDLELEKEIKFLATGLRGSRQARLEV